jgi:hypothetical protein
MGIEAFLLNGEMAIKPGAFGWVGLNALKNNVQYNTRADVLFGSIMANGTRSPATRN